MSYWIREAVLTIGNKKYSLEDLDFKFEIPFEDTDEVPVATVTVTNLAPDTRANIQKNDPVILNAGYEGNVGCILIGKVVGLRHKQAKTDWTTTITVQPCADEILDKLINKTYVENSTAMSIVRDMLNIFGVEVAECALSNDRVYPRGRVCRGVLRQVLAEIVVSECKSRFVVRNTGQVYITKAESGINNGVILTPANGLLRSDEDKTVIPFETKKNSQQTNKKKKKSTKKQTAEREEKNISRACLLNYNIAAAELIKIQSNDLNGRFTVVKGKHIGGRTGDWKTTMELKPYT